MNTITWSQHNHSVVSLFFFYTLLVVFPRLFIELKDNQETPESAGVVEPADRQGALEKRRFFFFLVLNFAIHYDAAVLDFRVGLGFCSGCRLGGPVGVHAEFLGQVHVSGLGCHVARAAQPGETFG